MKSVLRMCEKQTNVKPNGIPEPMHMCCNIHTVMLLQVRIMIQLLCYHLHILIPHNSVTQKNSLPFLGKYQHLSVFRAETKAPVLFTACKQLLTQAELLSHMLPHPTTPQIL